jgi:hypothetical protein
MGDVTPVKNQLSCSCCWAFAATATIESQLLIKGAGAHDLSEQDLVNCAATNCNAQSLDLAYYYIINNGQALDSSVPYTGTVSFKLFYHFLNFSYKIFKKKFTISVNKSSFKICNFHSFH